jgi:hypothetical protein
MHFSAFLNALLVSPKSVIKLCYGEDSESAKDDCMSDFKDYYHYLPTSERDRQWGLYVVGAGYQHIPPKHMYPPSGHPGTHSFVWQFGRILQEYQILYITAGAGEFESTPTGRITVTRNLSVG